MESAIPITRAYERGDGSETGLPEMLYSGGTGRVPLFEDVDLKDRRSMPNVSVPFLEKPIETLFGTLKSLRPITLELVSGTDLEPVWDYLVKQFHYLGYQKLLGHRLKYLALVGEHPVAALSWSAAALRIGVRDRFIGWSEEQRKSFLDRIANNSRFLIFPKIVS